MKKTKNKILKAFGVVAIAVVALCTAWMPGGNVFAAEPVSCAFDEGGNRVCDIDLTNFGYGSFVITARGTGVGGEPDTDVRRFYYYPAYANLVQIDGRYYLDVHYNWDDGSDDPTGDVARVEIKVYYPNSDEEVPFSPIEVPLDASGISRVPLQFEEYGMEEGDYIVEVYAYNRNDRQLSLPFTFVAEYRIEETPVPDTGGAFQNTNISKTDYLVTGLVVFGIVAIAGVMFILRSDKKQTSRRTRRRK